MNTQVARVGHADNTRAINSKTHTYTLNAWGPVYTQLAIHAVYKSYNPLVYAVYW